MSKYLLLIKKGSNVLKEEEEEKNKVKYGPIEILINSNNL